MIGFIIHVFIVFGALMLTLSLLQWGKFFCLDEFAEYPKAVLEVMCQPLEGRIKSISRAKCLTGFLDGSSGLAWPSVA